MAPIAFLCNRSTTAVKQNRSQNRLQQIQIFFLQMSGSLSGHGSRSFKKMSCCSDHVSDHKDVPQFRQARNGNAHTASNGWL